VIAVHTFGAPADVSSLRKSADNIVEDCCQALGGVGETGMLGREGDASVFSFYATKIITGGQGGLVWSKNSSISTAIMDYRQFDCREEFRPRFNLQMTDIQAALINSQMSRLDAICNRRLFVSQSYVDVLPSGLTVQSGVTDVGRAAYRFIVMAPDLFSRDALRNHMEDAGVGCAIPVQRYELLHRYLKLDEADFPVAEDLANRTVSLPIHAGLTDSQIEHVASALSRFSP
jgi:perosamine synthetase